MQMLDERGEIATPRGQRVVSILLLEDLLIVPLLALVAFLASPGAGAERRRRRAGWPSRRRWRSWLGALVAAGRWLLNPLFRIAGGARRRAR